MDPQDEKKLIKDIIRQRSLSYSLELLDVQGDKYKFRTNFGSEIVYVNVDCQFFMEA
jgi:hypothetical protein